MSELGIRPPLRIRRLNAECIAVEDAAGLRLACMYMDTDDARRQSRQSLLPTQAEAVAKVIARALTTAAEDDAPAEAGPRGA